MIAYHNDPKIKAKYLRRVKAHAVADEIIKGKYWENGRGCAVGCTVHSSNHSAYEVELGIPIVLARLEDRIFEGLPNELSKTWPEMFLKAIKVGKDLSKVWPKFAIFLLTDPKQCNSQHVQCDVVAEAYRQELAGTKQDWPKIRSAADTAANAAANAAANTTYAAAYAAYAAANAAANAAAYATYVAANAAANATYVAAYAAYAAANATYVAANAANARKKAYISQSKKLLQLLGEE